MCASFGTDGRWLSLGAPHPVHGFVELNGLPRFDERWRGDTDAVRRYRSWMTDDRYALLVVDAATVEDARPTPTAIVARYRVRAAERIVVTYHGRLDRPAYAEITDISPLPPLSTPNRLRCTRNVLRVLAPSLPATATLAVSPSAGWTRTGHNRASTVVGPAMRDLMVTVSCSLSD